MKLEGNVAVVMGEARCMGKIYCDYLLTRKVKVCLTDADETTGRAAEKELQEKYGAENVIFHVCDTAVDEQIRQTLKFVKEHFGRLDIVLNDSLIIDEYNWQKAVDINLYVEFLSLNLAATTPTEVHVQGSTIRVTNAVLDLIGKNNGGSGGILATTASNSGLMPSFYHPVYCATKAAQIAYNRAWTHKINYSQHGVRMFTLCPKVTDTPFAFESLSPTRVRNYDILLGMMNLEDKSQFLKPEWLAETMMKCLEDDNINGAAIQLLGPEPVYHFLGENTSVAAAQRVQQS